MAQRITMKTALLLIAHGSRHADANADLFALAEELRRTGPYGIVEASFLELAQPTIDSAGRHCVDQGAERVILLPYFLSAGVHVKRDLQDQRERLATEFAAAEFILAQPLGPHALLREILLQRARESEPEA
ncbi:MAG: cobalamin biosynthesis protein CbiX [Gemmataceae bacterium]|nr:cobalamin biosynthesis protein CbiX [Gemmataceae bacterium]